MPKMTLKRMMPFLIPAVVLVIVVMVKLHGIFDGSKMYTSILKVMVATALVFLMMPALARVFANHPVNGRMGFNTTANHQVFLYGGDLYGTRFTGMSITATCRFLVPLSYSGSSTLHSAIACQLRRRRNRSGCIPAR